MNTNNEMLSLFHHIHHINSTHEVHHCGGKHKSIDPNLDYTIKHCKCGKHSINKKEAIGHATHINLDSIEVKIKFLEKCPYGGWHIKSGIKVEEKRITPPQADGVSARIV